MTSNAIKKSKTLSSLLAGLLLFFVTLAVVHAISHAEDFSSDHTNQCEVCKVLASTGGIDLPGLFLAFIGLALATTQIFCTAPQDKFQSRDLLQSSRSRAPPALA